MEEREVIRKIKVPAECTWFVQAILEDTGLVAVSLGGKESLTVFYDSKSEEEVGQILDLVFRFCKFEILHQKAYNVPKRGNGL